MMLDVTDADFSGMLDEGGAILTDPDAERALLGYMLLKPDEIETVADHMRADDLADNLHRRIFDQLHKAYEEGRNISVKVVAEGLGGDPNAKIFGDLTVAQYVASLMAGAEPSDDPSDLAGHLVAVAERRATSLEAERIATEPFQSRYGLVMWSDQNEPGPAYEFIIEDLIPKGEGVVLMGESQTGKSFLTHHMAMCGARGVPFFGRRILQPFGTIWCAYEAARGQTARMRAYRRYHNLDLEHLPFAVLTRPLSLWPDPKAADELIKEMKGIVRTQFGKVPLGMIVFDTYNAATPGASEIDSQVVSQIRKQFDRIRDELGASTIIVGHTNAVGKHRGNEQLTNNIDTVILVSRKLRPVSGSQKEMIDSKDDNGHAVRKMTVKKQREGEQGEEHEFVLRVVEDGTRNAFGRNRTSCVVAEPHYIDAPSEPEAPADRDHSIGVRVPTQTKLFLECVLEIAREAGKPAPAELGLARNLIVADYAMVKRLFGKKSMADEVNDSDRNNNADSLKTAIRRARERLLDLKVIGNDSPTNLIWWTGKPVRGMRETQPRTKDMFKPDPSDEFFASGEAEDFK